MNKVGFIGYGSMGSMLVNGFLSEKVLNPEMVVISNRTLSKIEPLAQLWKGVTLTNDNRELARISQRIFLCVKPFDTMPVLHQIKGELSERTHLVSIAAGVTLADIGSCFAGQVTKVIPSMTLEVKEGISLTCHNKKVASENIRYIETLLKAISTVMHVQEENFEVAADLTSCGPGLIAAMFDNFVQAGIRHGGIPLDEARQMVVSTLLGTAKLLAEKGFDFSELINRVATKGGITEEGVKVLNARLPQVFNEVFYKTMSKHENVKKMIKGQMAGAR